MNIGQLINSLSPKAGGLYEAVRRLSQSMSASDCAVTAFGVDDAAEAAQVRAGWEPVPAQICPRLGPGALGYSADLSGRLLEARLDLLHAHGLWQYSSAASLSWHRRTRKPCIIHPHGMLDPWAVRNSRWKKRLAGLAYERAHLESAACLRALCESEARSIRQFGLSNPICVIPNGMDLPEQGVTRPAPWPEEFTGRKVLLYLGRLHPKKNLGPLLEAWSVARCQQPGGKDWVLALAGWDQGGYEEQLRRQSNVLQIEDSVRFLGPLFGEKKLAAYQNCQAFILPSLSEGLPMVVLEAWAFARPVLMTEECNLPEGFAAEAAWRIGTEAGSITGGLTRLFQSSDTDLENIGRRGRALVERKFTWTHISAEMRRVSDWCLGGGPRPDSVRLD